jgi:misacylated tRNA(Ala) deacylase
MSVALGVIQPHGIHTHRLDLEDATLREWDATVLHVDPEQGIVLDRSAFYPGGGGQPPDRGVLLWGGVQTRIAGARKGDEVYLIPVDGDPVPLAGATVRGALDDVRRTALMRTHSAMHLLCGVVSRDYGVAVTGGAMDELSGRMDFGMETLPEGFLDAVQQACLVEVAADRAIQVSEVPRSEAVVKTATDLLPEGLEVVRIVDIVGLDRQADGGTHVASTRFIGDMRLLKTENKGKGFRRIRFALS